MRLAKNLPNVELVAVCDVYGQHMRNAAEIAGPGCRTSVDYRTLLDAKDIDGVIIGTPDHWHKQMTLEAVAAGKDVYVEKPVSHTIEEGAAMVQAIESSARVVQTGTQQRSWEITGWESRSLIRECSVQCTAYLRTGIRIMAENWRMKS